MFDEELIEIEGPTSDVRPLDGSEDPRKGTEATALSALFPAGILALAYAFFGLEVSGVAGGGVALVLLLWPLIAAGVLIVSYARGRSLRAARALVHVIVFAIAVGSVAVTSAWQRERAEKAGDVIGVALDRHRAALGQYPNSLAELVPHFIKEVPRPQMGVFAQDPFLYRANRGQYMLQFKGAAMRLYMRGPAGKWLAVE